MFIPGPREIEEAYFTSIDIKEPISSSDSFNSLMQGGIASFYQYDTEASDHFSLDEIDQADLQKPEPMHAREIEVKYMCDFIDGSEQLK